MCMVQLSASASVRHMMPQRPAGPMWGSRWGHNASECKGVQHPEPSTHPERRDAVRLQRGKRVGTGAVAGVGLVLQQQSGVGDRPQDARPHLEHLLAFTQGRERHSRAKYDPSTECPDFEHLRTFATECEQHVCTNVSLATLEMESAQKVGSKHEYSNVSRPRFGN